MNPLIKAIAPITARVRTDVTAKKGPGGMVWTREPLTDAMLAKHLNGGPYRGVCPVKAGESVTLVGMYDLDSHKGETSWADMIGIVDNLIGELERRGMHPVAFRSSGGFGVHVYMVWDDPQDAYSVRQFMTDALGAVGYKNGTAGVSKGEIEVFPKQDDVPVDGFGNQFILPLAGESAPLDPMLGFEVMPKDHALGIEWKASPSVPKLEKPVRDVVSSAPSGNIERLVDALSAIPNDGDGLDYDAWRNVIFGIHHATNGSAEGKRIAHEFSARSAKYDKAFLDKNVWRHIKSDRPNAITERTILDMARDAGWAEDVTEDFEVVEAEVITMPNGAPAPAAPRQLDFTRHRDGDILATIRNTVAAVGEPTFCGFVIGFDDFRDEIMFHRGDHQWESFLDEHYVELRIALARRRFKEVGRDLIRDAVHKVAKDNRFDSARVWLDSLSWDGVSRVETFLSTYFGVTDSDYARAVSLYMWSAIAGRVIAPGIKCDMVPILVGDQGLGKSSAVAAMVPSVEYFTEISFHEKDDDNSRKIRGKLIAEIGELRGLHTKELESIKAFITRTNEHWIPKFKEFSTTFPRRLIFIGTTNRDEFLADSTGNRRWLPVTVGSVDVEGIKRDRDQLWAEGAALFTVEGVMWQKAENLAEQVHENHTISDSWESTINGWLFSEDHFGIVPMQKGYVTTEEILSGALGVPVSQHRRPEQMRVADVMKSLGFDVDRPLINGKRVRHWVKR
jgi:predicted P-loop ATPase